MDISRREIALTLSLGLSLSAFSARHDMIKKDLMMIEKEFNGRLGVALIGEKGFQFLYRPNERFNYCSVFKWILGAAVLYDVQNGKLSLDQKIYYSQKDILNPAPVTRDNLKRGYMQIGELCLATISQSDNTAANLLTHQIGGLETLRRFVKLSGDQITRFDRLEPYLNRKEFAHDERDTSTAFAMSKLLHSVLNGPKLNAANKEILKSWMRASTTGFERIRASIPKNWDIGDKTGTSGIGTANDVAFFTTHKGQSYCLTVFSERQGEDNNLSNHAIASATKHMVKLIT